MRSSASASGLGCACSPSRASLGAPWFRQFDPISLDWPRRGGPREYKPAPGDRPIDPGFLELAGPKRRRKRSTSTASCRGGIPTGEVAARIRKRAGTNAALNIAASATMVSGSVALAFPPPWGELAAASAYATAAAMKIAVGLRKNADLALSGDDKAIAGWIKRIARWSEKKRHRKASELAKVLGHLVKRCSRMAGHGKRLPTPLLVHMARIRLKAAALVAVFAESQKAHRATPLVQGDPRTAAAATESDPAANVDNPGDDVAPFLPDVFGIPGPLLLGGAVVAALVGIAALASRPAARRAA